ncbi:hypothetical protein [Photorhabdus laumondii]|uniref:hypothetical protein n=1 Tax=Photorhabdus laumondii TaxID=2218628 RepID=UPI001F4E4767|nr:hypothetical protein [Photorhabdus laumondii]
MEAQDEILTLQNDSDETPIYWPVFHGNMADDGKIFNLNISTGTLKVDYTSENRDHTVAYLGCAENASLNLKDSGILKITNPGTVFMFIDYITLDKNKYPKLTMSGNSQFEIKQIKKILSDSPAFIFLASDISLHGSSQFTLESSDLYLGDGNFNYCNINICDDSVVNLSNNGIMLRSGIDEVKTKLKESTVAMSGKSQLTVEVVGTVEKTQENNEVLKTNISLNCDFFITEYSNAMLKSHFIDIYNSNIILQDNAQMSINSQKLKIRTDLDEKGQPLFDTNFTLKAGATSLNLNSIDGIHFPLNIHRENYPKGVFNFMAEGKENTGKVVIDVAPKDANAYGLNTLLRKNFTAINGKIVETGDQMKYFDFNYGKDIRNGNQVGTITISLRNPHLKLS